MSITSTNVGKIINHLNSNSIQWESFSYSRDNNNQPVDIVTGEAGIDPHTHDIFSTSFELPSSNNLLPLMDGIEGNVFITNSLEETAEGGTDDFSFSDPSDSIVLMLGDYDGNAVELVNDLVIVSNTENQESEAVDQFMDAFEEAAEANREAIEAELGQIDLESALQNTSIMDVLLQQDSLQQVFRNLGYEPPENGLAFIEFMAELSGATTFRLDDAQKESVEDFANELLEHNQ